MRTKRLRVACALALALAVTSPAYADEGMAVAVDAVIVRPVCLVATVLGCAFFVISLPFAATSHSIDHTADVLIYEPAKATFKRPMGNFDSLGKE